MYIAKYKIKLSDLFLNWCLYLYNFLFIFILFWSVIKSFTSDLNSEKMQRPFRSPTNLLIWSHHLERSYSSKSICFKFARESGLDWVRVVLICERYWWTISNHDNDFGLKWINPEWCHFLPFSVQWKPHSVWAQQTNSDSFPMNSQSTLSYELSSRSFCRPLSDNFVI